MTYGQIVISSSPGTIDIRTRHVRSSIFTINYNDVIIGAVASQITSPTIVYLTVDSDANQRKHQSSASLAFEWRIHRWAVNSPHKWSVTRKMFPFDDVIISRRNRAQILQACDSDYHELWYRQYRFLYVYVYVEINCHPAASWPSTAWSYYGNLLKSPQILHCQTWISHRPLCSKKKTDENYFSGGK